MGKVEQNQGVDVALGGVTLAVPADAYSPFWRHTIIGQMLDIQERENASREDFKPAISREMVERAINGLFGIYDCRSSDFAACYAWTGFWDTLGVDWRKLTFLSSESAETPPQPRGQTMGEQEQGDLGVAVSSDADQWFCERGEFWGTIKQLCLCAKCGKREMKRHDEPRHYAGIATPHLHMVCDDCFDSLPEDDETPTPTPRSDHE